MQKCVFYKAMHQHFNHFAFSLKGRIRMQFYWKCVCLKRKSTDFRQFCAKRWGWTKCFLSTTFPNAPAQSTLYFLTSPLLTWQPKSKQKQGEISLAGVIKLIGSISSPQRTSNTQADFVFPVSVC